MAAAIRLGKVVVREALQPAAVLLNSTLMLAGKRVKTAMAGARVAVIREATKSRALLAAVLLSSMPRRAAKVTKINNILCE
jgi:hypothetical protein